MKKAVWIILILVVLVGGFIFLKGDKTTEVTETEETETTTEETTSVLSGSGVYTVVPSASTLGWTASKVIIVGTENKGTVAVKSGSVEINNGELVGGSFVVDMTTITPTSIHDGKDNAMSSKLIEHLSSDEFFGVTKFPTSEYKVTSVTKTGEGEYAVTGDLTIKDITKPVVFPIKLSKNETGQLIAGGILTIDRTEFDIKFGSGKFFEDLGDDAINDTFTLEVSLVGEMAAENTAL